MLVFSRIFLILLVPLLTHGAPTPPHDDNPQPGSQLKPLPRPVDKNLVILPHGTKYRNLGRIENVRDVGSTTKERIVYTDKGVMIYLPKGTRIKIGETIQLPSTNPGKMVAKIVNSQHPLVQATCVLLKYTQFYRPEQVKPRILNTKSMFSISLTDQVAITSESGFVFIPSRTTIILSDHISLPTGRHTKIRRIDDTKLPAEITSWTNEIWKKIKNGEFDKERLNRPNDI